MKAHLSFIFSLVLFFNSSVFAQNKSIDSAEFDDGLLMNQKNNMVYSGSVLLSVDTVHAGFNQNFLKGAMLIYHPEESLYLLSYNDDNGNPVKYELKIEKSKSTGDCNLLIDQKGGQWCMVDNLKTEGQFKIYCKSRQEMLLFKVGVVK